MKQAQEFLIGKEQTRVILQLKGRERSRPEKGVELLNSLIYKYFDGYGVANKPATVTNLSLTFMPKKK